MRDAAVQRADIQAGGCRIVFVHLASEDTAKPFFKSFGMDDVDRISDPDGSLYEAFGLDRAGIKQILSPSVWFRGVSSILGHGLGIPRGDTLRMPGAFLVNRGKVAKSFFHETIATRPNMKEFAKEGVEACRI